MSMFQKKKKKLNHMCLEKPFSSSCFFDEIIDLVNAFWQRIIFYYFIRHVLNESQRWKYDYIIMEKNNQLKSKWTRQVSNLNSML